ncbi:MAG: methylenetetrahydrofolate reductase [NAD(P)H] [Cyclobacteriaceae bacterium]
MKVIDHINNSEKTLFSLEIIPPLKGDSINSLFENLDPLMEYKPPFIDVTYHREESVLRKRVDGGYDRISVRKRPGTVGICSAIKHRYDVDPVPHIICGGFTREETENALIDLHFLGIDNVLVIRGDNMKPDNRFIPETGGNNYAIELVDQVIKMNKGVYQDPELESAQHTNFCIGVAGYPEKHMESPNLKADVKHLKDKIDLGADYIVTQMFFDNQKYFDFVAACRDAGINVPIIPGLKPLTTKKQITVLPSVFHIDIPEDLYGEVLKCKDNKAVREIGIEWGIKQTKELIERGAPVIHYYSMGKSNSIEQIAKELF